MNLNAILDRASKYVNSWPEWMRSDENRGYLSMRRTCEICSSDLPHGVDPECEDCHAATHKAGWFTSFTSDYSNRYMKWLLRVIDTRIAKALADRQLP